MSRLAALFGAPTPSLGVEISATRVAVVRLAPDGDPALVTGLAVEALPAGAVVPALNATNIADRAAVSGAIRRGVQQLGGRGRRAVLVLPDTIAKVSLLRFDKVPTRAADLAALVSWQVRKSAPFPANQAQLSYVAGATVDGGAREFVVTMARTDIVAEYEGVCQDAGLHTGVVDLATFNLVNAVLAAGGPSHGDALLVNLAPDYLAVVILRDGQLMFYRHRGSDGEGSLADVVHQTAMYYEDRLGGRGFTRAILAGAGRARVAAAPEFAALDIDGVRRQLEARLDTRVEMIDPRPAVTLTDRIGTDAALLDTLAPVVGLLLRERTQ
jgi:Tfp pilus assembly PilM family ATPase